MMRLFVLVSVVALAACRTPVGVKSTSLESDSGAQCASLCAQVGMPLDSLVIMADNIGCVCRAAAPASAAPPGATPGATPVSVTGASSAGGMAAIMIAQQQRQQQAAAQQQRK